MKTHPAWPNPRQRSAADNSLSLMAGAEADRELNLFDEGVLYESIFPEEDNLPELEDILPNGGHDFNDLRYVSDVILANDPGVDILKSLAIEYKRFMLWNERDEKCHNGFSQQHPHTFRKDNHFDSINEDLKDKTLTECLLDQPFLMEKIWPELNCDAVDDNIFSTEEKIDILSSLLPDDIIRKSHQRVSEMILRDLYKVGLDSNY